MLLASKNIMVARTGAANLHFPDLQMKENERILVLGPSGSGKTTWLSVLAGLLKPDAGQVMLGGQDIYALPARQLDKLRGQKCGFIFQSLHLLPSLTLSQNIRLAPDMAGIDVAGNRIDQLIAVLGLAGKGERYPHALSIGEQQRGAIARAVVNAPQVIFADEPTSALDDANADAVMHLLQEQATATKASLIVATHDQRIMKHFDTVIRLDIQTGEKAA